MDRGGGGAFRRRSEERTPSEAVVAESRVDKTGAGDSGIWKC